jgi:hypothetical protein
MSASPVESFKINLNQNLWGLVVSLVSLGAAEYFKLCTLFWFSVVVAVVMTISIGITTYAYTKTYWKNKNG